METLLIILISLIASALVKPFFNLIGIFPSPKSSSSDKKLPPGPAKVPVIGNLIWLRKSFLELEPVLRNLRGKYGPIITLRFGNHPAIFISSHSGAHQALVQNGVVFSDRPKALAASKVLNSNQRNISSAAYGPTWRILRRNLTFEILHPSRIKSYSNARRWVLGILIDRLAQESSATGSVRVVDHFQYAMFCLLVLMCFGDRLQEKQIKQIEAVQRELLLSFRKFNILNFWPRLGRIFLRKRWKELFRLRENQERVLFPLIRSRIEFARKQQQEKQGKQQQEQQDGGEEASVVAYVDTLMDIQLPGEKRKLNDGEILTLCNEFLNAGTDTTSTALQWIMANLVKYPEVQAELYKEIVGVVGPKPPESQSQSEFIKEEDLQKMPYLKAVVLEGLRRHPPGHFVLPHKVTEDVVLEGYLIPKDATINFMVAEMGWDPQVWDDPMEFKPERFLGSASSLIDITGNREIKMMPFGAGRRICPASNLALLHLELFITNLIWHFQWTPADGDEVHLSEKQEFTTVMKYPLRAHLTPRS